MSKAVLISIKPQWCALIANGEKTIEVRKTRPKLDPPFKFYIYCTNGGRLLYKSGYNNEIHLWQIKEYETTRDVLTEHGHQVFNGKVIGEFVCDEIDRLAHMGISLRDVHLELVHRTNWGSSIISDEWLHQTCLTMQELESYSAGGDLYGLHISDLVIYDEPKELSEFVKIGDCDAGPKCKKCPYFEKGNEAAGLEDDCVAPFDTTCYSPITRPPQSWCYVEELK